MRIKFRPIFQFFANRLHNVKHQLIFSAVFGLIYLYGVGGTLAILMKVRKEHDKAIREKKGKMS